jgi:hypothetical protein
MLDGEDEISNHRVQDGRIEMLWNGGGMAEWRDGVNKVIWWWMIRKENVNANCRPLSVGINNTEPEEH